MTEAKDDMLTDSQYLELERKMLDLLEQLREDYRQQWNNLASLAVDRSLPMELRDMVIYILMTLCFEQPSHVRGIKVLDAFVNIGLSADMATDN